MAGTGGKRKGAGRKSKAEEAKANKIFIDALKRIYNKDEDEEAKIEFVVTLAESQRGQIFIAEHLFGKPKELVDVTSNGENIGFSKINFINSGDKHK